MDRRIGQYADEHGRLYTARVRTVDAARKAGGYAWFSSGRGSRMYVPVESMTRLAAHTPIAAPDSTRGPFCAWSHYAAGMIRCAGEGAIMLHAAPFMGAGSKA